MPKYVDGFVIPIARDQLPAYRKLAKLAAKVWMEHGALEYRECVGEDLDLPYGKPFPKALKLKPGETVLFSWITYKSRKHRDKVNALVMNDPRLAAHMDPANMPFDLKRMTMGGFTVLVEA